MIEFLIQHPQVERLGWVLMHSLWQGLALAIVLFLLLRLLPAGFHASRHNLAAVMLALWLALPAITWSQLGPEQLPTPNHSSTSVGVTTEPPVETAAKGAVVSDTDASRAPATGEPPGPTAVGIQGLPSVLPYLTLAWLTGTSFLLLRYAGGLVLIQQLRRSGRPLTSLESSLTSLVNRLEIKRHVRIAESSRIDSPSVMGIIRPVILLPASTVTGLSTVQLELILAHELAHLRRNDYLVSLMQGLSEAVLFYHPFTWWLSRVLNVEREHACDELALTVTGAQRVELAETLAQLEKARPVMKPALSASSNLTQRIWRLLRPDGAAAGPRPALLPLALVAVCSIWFAVAAQPTDSGPQWTVVIDAGHSSEFAGASVPGLEEADLVLTVARMVRDALVDQGVKVKMTRDDGSTLGSTPAEDLEARAALVTEDVDAFVSIHAGAASNSAMQGILAYVARSATGVENQSEQLADSLLQHSARHTGARSHPAREHVGFRLLDRIGNAVPAVMVEVGFLTNPREAEMLASTVYQERLAAGIAAGILSHLTGEDLPESEFFVRVRSAAKVPAMAIPERGWPTFHFLADLVQAVPFTLHAPSWLPEGYSLSNSVWIEEESLASITYQASSIGAGDDTVSPPIFFTQSPEHAFERLRIGVEADSERLTVNGRPGVFVPGAWSAGDAPEWIPGRGGILVWNGNGKTYVIATASFGSAEARETLLQSAVSLTDLGGPALRPLQNTPPVSERHRQWVSVYGDVTVRRAADGDLELNGDGYIVVEERTAAGARSKVVSLRDGAGDGVYRLDGAITELEQEGRVWFTSILSDNVLEKLNELRESGAMRAATYAVQEGGVNTSIIMMSEGLQFDRSRLYRLPFLQLTPGDLTFESLTQAYAHGFTSQELFESNLRDLLPLVDIYTREYALYSVAHVTDPELQAQFMNILSAGD